MPEGPKTSLNVKDVAKFIGKLGSWINRPPSFTGASGRTYEGSDPLFGGDPIPEGFPIRGKRQPAATTAPPPTAPPASAVPAGVTNLSDYGAINEPKRKPGRSHKKQKKKKRWWEALTPDPANSWSNPEFREYWSNAMLQGAVDAVSGLGSARAGARAPARTVRVPTFPGTPSSQRGALSIGGAEPVRGSAYRGALRKARPGVTGSRRVRPGSVPTRAQDLQPVIVPSVRPSTAGPVTTTTAAPGQPNPTAPDTRPQEYADALANAAAAGAVHAALSVDLGLGRAAVEGSAARSAGTVTTPAQSAGKSGAAAPVAMPGVGPARLSLDPFIRDLARQLTRRSAVPGVAGFTRRAISALPRAADQPIVGFSQALSLSPYAQALPAQDPACKCKERKKERKPRAPRSVCYRGTYIETARGLRKQRREQVPC